MNRVLQFLIDPRFLGVVGVLALVMFFVLGADAMKLGLVWALVLAGLTLLVAGSIWLVRRMRARRAAQQLEQGIEADAEAASKKAVTDKDRAAAQALRTSLQEALAKIKGSKMGQAGQAALYQLPWYMIIGNPAAGKSMAVARSGLKFPFADKTSTIIQGIGGTRNCDWFFTNDGILLDTAGRYAVHAEDRSEWLGFLKLLKKSRPLAPINGIVVAASIGDLISARPEANIALARSLRQRVQELTESLEVTAPVYVLFTKADLIAGFSSFFDGQNPEDRSRVWGATLPYNTSSAPAATPAQGENTDAVSLFERHFDELLDGVREMGLTRLSLQRGQALQPSVLSFPLEFAALKPALRAFVGSLFEDNPYQNRPVFRGFYFTSATQQPGHSSSQASEEVAGQFGLKAGNSAAHAGAAVADQGYFLRDLFSSVIFADRELVRQNKSPQQLRVRQWGFVAAAAGLAVALTAWAWSYQGNRQLVHGVNLDLATAQRLQEGRADLSSRLEALEILQRRIEELDGLRSNPPLGLTLGLFQGDEVDRKLRREYFNGVQQVLMQPAIRSIEGYLGEVVANAGRLTPGKGGQQATAAVVPAAPGISAVPAILAIPGMPAAPAAPAAAAPSRYADASPTNADEAYDALAAYLMLSDGDRKPAERRADSGHLKLQLTKFWRRWLDEQRGNVSRDVLYQRAESLVVFAMANLGDPDFPWLKNRKLDLEMQVREALRKVRQGMPARERVLAAIVNKARREFPDMTVARILTERSRPAEPGLAPAVAGSQVVSGAYTRQAWQGFVDQAIKDAAEKDLQAEDWVLGAPIAADDNSMAGSAAQVRASLTDLYKTEYVRQWQRFLQGVAVVEFKNLEEAGRQLNRLGDASDSPIKHVLDELLEQTTWDNPSLLNERLGQARKGILDWIKQSLQSLSPSKVDVNVNVGAPKAVIPVGPVGREFAALPRMMMTREGTAPPVAAYLQALGKLRSRLTTLRDQGAAGPGARLLVAATLEGTSSELVDANRVVEDQMLAGMTEAQRSTMRPLLVRPLEQTFKALIPEAETEVNRRWEAEVFRVFMRDLVGKSPFETRSGAVDAGREEIGRVFGPEGSIAKFGSDAIGPLVSRDASGRIVPREWLRMGLRLRPSYAEGYSRWTAPLAGAAAPAAAAGGAAAPTQGPAFQIMSLGSQTLREHTLVIDGQELRYQNMAEEWKPVFWPNPGSRPGVRITAITNDGQSLVFVDEPGEQGLDRMLEAAALQRQPDGVRLLTWTQGVHKLSVKMRLLRGSSSGTGAPAGAERAPDVTGLASLRDLRLPEVVVGTEASKLTTPASGGAATGGAIVTPSGAATARPSDGSRP